MFVTVEVLYGTWRKRGRKRESWSISNIVKHNICDGTGNKDMKNTESC
jgi:hypothetical protein